MKAVMIAAAVVITVIVVLILVLRIRRGGGCCGEHEQAPKKLKASRRSLTDHKYTYIAEVDGMVCSNCLTRVENAFNRIDGIYAKGELSSKTVKLLSISPLTRRQAADILSGTTYTLIDLREERK